MRTSRARMTSWLASVALVTVVPPTNTGSSTAVGATLPIFPTSQTTSASTVVFSSAANLYASAPRGLLDRVPAAAYALRSASRSTAPSRS